MSDDTKDDGFWHHLQPPDADEDNPDNGLTTAQKIEYYSAHAEEYDEEQIIAGFNAPIELANVLHKYLQGKVDTKILDVAGGTGEVVKRLRKFAPYNNIDGLDAAEGMLKVAKRNGFYNKTFCVFFGLNTGMEHNSYDVVCCTGAIGPGHIKMDGFQEMLDIVKPGGYVIAGVRAIYTREYPQYTDMLPMLHRWQDEGKITIVEESSFDDFYPGFDGITLVLKKL